MESLQLNQMKDQDEAVNNSLQELPNSTTTNLAPAPPLSPMQATVPSLSPDPRASSNPGQYQQYSPQSVSPSTLSHHQLLKRIFKIIVIGDSNVGKTCLSFRFCGGKFLQRSEATIGVDFREKTIQIDDETIKLQIWDTAGQERFRKSMISHYYRNVHAVLFVYDVTNASSFENLSYWIEEYNRHCGIEQPSRNIPRILVGNKCDLTSETRVNTNMAQTFADMHEMPLFETSAKDDSKQDHVEAIFMTLAFKLKNSKPFYTPNQLHKAPVQSVDHRNTYSTHSNSNNEANNQGGCVC